MFHNEADVMIITQHVLSIQGSVCAGGAPPPPASAGPPPPPPPAVLPPTDAPKPSGDAAAKANLFASLNKGADVTKGTNL